MVLTDHHRERVIPRVTVRSQYEDGVTQTERTNPALGFHSEVWITLWKTDGLDHISPRKTYVL